MILHLIQLFQALWLLVSGQVEVDACWQVKPLPQFFPNFGYDGMPFWGCKTTYYNGYYHAFGLWWFSIGWHVK